MTGGPPLSPDRVPTLTEVVAWPESGAAALSEGAMPPAAEASPDAGYVDADAPLAVPGAMLSEEQLAQRVLVDLQRQIDLMLDYRLREVLTPLLTRAADSIVREARTELASTLREAVSRAVAQELARHRGR
ncbi:MAG TPA: hypothetical protein VNU71_10605 [Burkholderiaceae bacterium]|nr:hypothetical protein [Burkholderiaceae bacterium]